MKTRLLGTSPNLEMLTKLVTEYFYGQPMNVFLLTGQIIRVSDSKIIEGLRVIKKGDRYRFEIILD